ncbi:MAG: penicillin-binding protein 2 [Desulfobacteraceae bacterium]|nr:penicillin-binding protein 2 [Pseudomonadota bacterium]MBU4463352.1 penicillin-binding protein 2 [Pseudomonadota bacterium]MCG2754998.1 penicillin-binding protein 2 [Desulfobacteraceae bacterium]
MKPKRRILSAISDRDVQQRRIGLRSILIGFIFSIVLVAIGAKAVYLQVFCGPWLSQKAADQYEKSFISPGKRGTIYDANHREIAVSIDVASIAAYPQNISEPGTTARLISRALKIDESSLYRKLNSKKRSFVWVKRHVTPSEADQVKNLNLKGIDFMPENKRFYPNKTLAAQVLGFSGLDGHGLEGIEFYYNNYLEGAAGKFTVLKDAFGRGFNGGKAVAGDFGGNNLILTIDRTIQYIAESALEEAVDRFSAKSGMAIVMVPKTGAILAMAHHPIFNPNTFRGFKKEMWRNRAIADQFEPGSTMKIFSAAAALRSGKCTQHTIFYCENGEYRIGKNIVHDTKPHGWMSLQQIVKYSSNIGIVKVCETIGPDLLYKTLSDFGFGKKSGIDCPGETAGSMAQYKRWSKIDAGAISFGQGISVSALQLITATSAIANDGILMKPYIVQAIMDQNGRLIKSSGPCEVRRVISVETAGTLKKIMESVTNNGGTGVNAALEGYSVCGKTGTAQKVDEKGTYAKDKYIASFVGFAPSQNPEIAVLVVIDEPGKEYYSSIVAAPTFKKIVFETLNYMNLPATHNAPYGSHVNRRAGLNRFNGPGKIEHFSKVSA